MANLNQHDIIFLNSLELKELKEKIECAYNFEILTTDFPNVISFTSKKLIIYTSRGTFFLKEKPRYCSDELSLKRAAHFQEYVSFYLDIVPKILVTKEKNHYINWNGRHYFLSEYKPGRHYNGSREDIDSIIQALYLFQECGAAYLKKYKDSRLAEATVYESIDVTLSLPDVNSQIKTQNDELVFQEILIIYENLCTEYLNLSREKYIMSHGDFILFNFTLNGSGVVAINDFDNTKVLPRIHDMAEFLVSASLLNYIAPLTNLKLPVLVNPDETTLRYIMKEYVLRFRLSNDEIVLLGSVTEIIWLWSLVLAVFKGDYSLSDLEPALESFRNRKVQTLIHSFATNL